MTSATLERTTLDISETLRKNSTLVYPFVSVFAIIAYFTITSPQFLTFDNATNIGRQAAVLLLVALVGRSSL